MTWADLPQLISIIFCKPNKKCINEMFVNIGVCKPNIMLKRYPSAKNKISIQRPAYDKQFNCLN